MWLIPMVCFRPLSTWLWDLWTLDPNGRQMTHILGGGDPNLLRWSWDDPPSSLQKTNIKHLGKRTIIDSNMPISGGHVNSVEGMGFS